MALTKYFTKNDNPHVSKLRNHAMEYLEQINYLETYKVGSCVKIPKYYGEQVLTKNAKTGFCNADKTKINIQHFVKGDIIVV